MTNELKFAESPFATPSNIDELLQRLVDQANRGTTIDVDAVCKQHPRWAEELRKILPALLLFDRSRMFVVANSRACFDSEHGRQIGNYHIGRVIGRGGMGVVYEATQSPLGRRVAIKLLKDVEATPLARQRFEQEFRIAASLHHTNIVPVFDAGEDNGQLYFAMQLIDGVRVSHWHSSNHAFSGRATSTTFEDSTTAIAESRVGDSQTEKPETEVLQASNQKREDAFQCAAMVGIQVSTALQFAHSRGILHRDVKPANILIDTNNNAWITDFGLAKPVDGENLTESGDIAGTIRYLAPERLQGKCDCRSDVYALGLVLLELITRRPAWDGANGAVLVKKLTDGDTCPFPVEANVPTDLRLIIKKAIQPHPEMRYQSALEMAEDLTLFVDGRPISARRFSRLHSAQLWARRNPTVAALWTTTILTLVVGTIAATALAINWRTAATKAALREQEATTERDRATDSLSLTREALAEMTSSVVARFLSRREQLTDSDREFLNKILEYHQQLGKLAATEEWARAVEAHGLRDVSKIRHLLGQIDQAADELRRSISMFDDLAEDYPETPEYRMEAAGVLLNLGRYLAENQRLDDALDCFQRASHAFALLPPIASFQSRIDGDHATAENNIANIHTMRANYEDAEIGYNKAIVIQLDLLSSDSESIEHRTGLARSLSNLASCLIKAGRLTDAAGIANEALSLRIEIAEQTNDPNHRLAVEGSWVILGRLHKSLDEFDKAAECLLKAESISAQLSADFPAVPKYRSRWSSSLGELAELSVQIGKSEKAIEYYERLILVRKQLTLEVPSQLNFHGWLAEAQDSLARLLKDTKPTMAVELWQQAIAGFTHIIEVDNSLLWAHEECNDSLVRMASCRWESLHDSTSALPLFEQAELTWKKLADENPENTRFRVWQSGIARNIGQILVEQGKLEQGLIRLRQALAIAEGIQPEQESYATAQENVASIKAAIETASQK